MKTISVQALAQSEILAGATKGIGDLAVLVADLPVPSKPVVLSLDFRGVSVATASYLREFVLGFRDYTVRNRPEIYPVIANPNTVVIEELSALLMDMRDAIIICKLDEGTVYDACVLGILDEKERLTLDAVLKCRDADAVSLMDASDESAPVSANAWNNRLAGLVAKRFLIEVRDGRKKRFSPVLEDLKNGS